MASLANLCSWPGVSFLAFCVHILSRMVIDPQLTAHVRTDLVLGALRMALGTRGPGAEVLLSSAGRRLLQVR